MNRKYSLRALHSKKTMAPPFKIPKKKQSAGSDPAHLHMQSPLSRLQSPASQLKSYGDQSSRGGADRMHAGSALGSSTDGQRVPCKPLLRDVVKTLLALNSPNKGPSTANHSSAGGWSHQSQAGQRAEVTSACLTNRWRPKRASDRLLQPALTSEPSSPPQKKKSDLRASFLSNQRVSVNTLDSLAELRGDKHAGSLSSSTLGRRTWSRVEPKGGAAERKSDGGNSSISISDQTSDDDFLSPSKDKEKSLLKVSCTPSVSTATLSKRMTPDRRRSVGRTAWLSSSLREDPREAERQRWAEFREKKKTNRLAVLRRQARKPRQTPTEPIVLSSEEEEGEEEEEEDGGRSSRGEESHPGSCEQKQAQQACSSKGETDSSSPPPSSMQLEFTSLHAGLTHANANGCMMISENEIRIPLKGVKEEEVSVVATQVRGYGVWDGGMAQGGGLLASWKGPAPSLLFLWVTDAQANLLQKELFAIQTPGAAAAAGPSCCFLLLVLKEQLQELQAALLASILDMKEYRKASSSSSGLTSPLEWTDGLLLLHSCPPPLDQHLLGLLGCAAESCGQVRRSQRRCSLNSPGLQQLPTRLIQYPAAPSKGRITVTKEDLACLDSGEFLNDVIIDFYLRFLLLEGVGGSVAERSHVFSSFFYKQLSRRRVAGEDETPSVPDRHMRHQRVKTWTRHVDIFTKDFLFVPVNQEAHWFLVVVCFPALEEVQYEDFQRPTGGSERAAGVTSQQAPDCTLQGCQRSSVWKRPCILVMDSLKLSYHENVCRLLRDYLQVEWQVRRGTPRLFTLDNMRSSNCRVPQQDNSSDCGVYLLQYAESFLQNPVVHFNIPLHLDHWFPRQRVRRKREEIRSLIMKMHQRQRDETS